MEGREITLCSTLFSSDCSVVGKKQIRDDLWEERFYVLSKGKKNLDAVRLTLSVENLLSGWLLKGWEVCFKSRGRKSQEEAEVVEVLKPKGRANNSVFLPLFVSRNRLNNRATGENDQEK